MSEKELNVQELPTYPLAHFTGELGIARLKGRWERNGQQLLGPLSRLILQYQPNEEHWIKAAAIVTGWHVLRVFAFQSAMSGIRILGGKSLESQKGITDAALYDLMFKLARKTHRGDGRQARSANEHG
jgi:hypothetical protein